MNPFSRVPISTILLLCAGGISSYAQRNNPYSANPDPRAQQAITIPNDRPLPPVESRPSVARQTYNIAAIAAARSLKPTEIYKIGIGDVLFISLKNASNASGYYTVRSDGTIDFPLAGESPVVEALTLDQLEDLLASGVTLYKDAQVQAKVREYASHKINVTGMVQRDGEKFLQREAMPLFTIKADAIVDPAATKVLIRRSEMAKPDVYSLHDETTDDVLIYPGYSIEFTADGRSATLASTGFFYIAGAVASIGQKELAAGMTVFQAVVASGGVKGNAKKAFVRRKSEVGKLTVAEYDLKKIRDGKTADPLLQPGDMIEITN
ncbi:MAG TPA: polysaccharide biosynthesis/export family protein [Pyrinomonadaceae bacterium]|jgi:protein involved in polysaccharide export with SLBB domain|nr:polysaccharide biosynthesis/export family protein [Pyrinomonadaceae bacterium]